MLRKNDAGFRKLIVWQEAKRLAHKIYNATKPFPKEEQYHLVSQLRRAATSIMANIAEGSAMHTDSHRELFYMRVRGSTAEVDCFSEFCFERQLLNQTTAEDLIDHCARLSYLLTQTIRGIHK